MTLSEILLASEFKIIGGCQYLWPCFGPNARYLDIGFGSTDQVASVVFDSLTQEVYSTEIFHDTQAWRWIDSRYVLDYTNECRERGINPYRAWDNIEFQTVDQAQALILINQLISQDPKKS